MSANALFLDESEKIILEVLDSCTDLMSDFLDMSKIANFTVMNCDFRASSKTQGVFEK